MRYSFELRIIHNLHALKTTTRKPNSDDSIALPPPPLADFGRLCVATIPVPQPTDHVAPWNCSPVYSRSEPLRLATPCAGARSAYTQPTTTSFTRANHEAILGSRLTLVYGHVCFSFSS